jgi:mRNA-degrading endonuclease RelE of RelBE toxin-antitoxin system
MGEVLFLKKYQELPTTDQRLVSDFIEFLLQKRKVQKPSTPQKKRILGRLSGQIWMSPDFDEPLDDLKEYTQ